MRKAITKTCTKLIGRRVSIAAIAVTMEVVKTRATEWSTGCSESAKRTKARFKNWPTSKLWSKTVKALRAPADMAANSSSKRLLIEAASSRVASSKRERAPIIMTSVDSLTTSISDRPWIFGNPVDWSTRESKQPRIRAAIIWIKRGRQWWWSKTIIRSWGCRIASFTLASWMRSCSAWLQPQTSQPR